MIHYHSFTPDERACPDCGPHTYEIDVHGRGNRVSVTAYIFRSWTGSRWLDGEPYSGPVYLLGTTTAQSCDGRPPDLLRRSPRGPRHAGTEATS